MEVADRAATIAELRRRLALLGGAPGRIGAAPCAAGRRNPAGFVAEPGQAGTVWVRRVSVDLGPFIERAGAPEPVRPDQLLALAFGTPGDADRRSDGTSLDPGAVAVLDIETLGLRGSGVLAFLVGVGVPSGSRLEIDQLLLCDPGDEPALLAAALSRLSGPRLLVTYNGRSFDLPVLRSRCIVNRLSPVPLEARLHCDLLAPVRRLFRDRLGACTLRQAEALLLGLEREDDVPGSEAPGRYQAWLSGRAPDALEAVVLHNQLDLCATMVLAARVAAHVEGRLVEPVHPGDRYHLGAHLERAGAADVAEGHYRAALQAAMPPWDARAGHRLALRLRRRGAGGVAEALAIWSRIWRREPLDLRAARSLAVTLERTGELAAALTVCERALRVCAEAGAWRVSRLRGAPRRGWEEDWQRRSQRLRSRLRRRAQSPPPRLLLGEAAAGGAAVLAY